MSGAALLPKGFEILDRFVDSWAIEGAANRARHRFDSDQADREAFFNAAKDLAASALDLLDQKPLDQFDDKDKCLMNLMLSLAHVSLAVEVQGDFEPQHAEIARHMKITRAVSDYNAGD